MDTWKLQIYLSWIFKSFSDATATASAANKIWIFKSFPRNAKEHTRGSLALLNDWCHRASGSVPSVSQTQNDLKIQLSISIKVYYQKDKTKDSFIQYFSGHLYLYFLNLHLMYILGIMLEN